MLLGLEFFEQYDVVYHFSTFNTIRALPQRELSMGLHKVTALVDQQLYHVMLETIGKDYGTN